MDFQSHSPEQSEGPREPEIIDLAYTVTGSGDIDSYPVGLAYLKEFFGYNPEELALNTALAGVQALEGIDNVMRTGEDVSVAGQKSLVLIDEILTALAEEDGRSAGFALLYYESAKLSGWSWDIDSYKPYLLNIRDDLRQHFSTDILKQRITQKYLREKDDVRNNLKPSLHQLQRSLEMFLNSRLEEILIIQNSHELDENWLFRDFCDPFYIARRLSDAENGRQRSGFNAQVLFALMEKARAMDIPGVDQIILQPNEV